MFAAGRRSPLNRRLDITTLVEWGVGVVLALTLVAYMLLGNYARLVADDFGTKLALQVRGFWRESIAEYQTHDGHFFGTALQDAGGMLNEAFVRVLPAILIAVWVVVLTLALRHLVPAASRVGRLLIAAGIVYATLRITPSPFLALYWMTASLAYIVPLLLSAVLVWMISRPRMYGRSRAFILAAAGVVAFLAAGEAETYTAAQTTALTVVVAVGVSRLSMGWRQKLPVLTAAWVGSVAGLCLMAAAPGNAIRSATITRVAGARPSLLRVPGITFSSMLHFFHVVVDTHWRGLLALAVLAALVGTRAGAMTRVAMRPALITVGLATLGAVSVVFGALAPAGLEEAGLPPLYSQIVPIHVCVCGVAMLGWLSGRLCRLIADRPWPTTGWATRHRAGIAAAASVIAGVAAAAGPISTLAAIRHDLPAIKVYAETKDAQAAAAEAAHAAGKTWAIVPAVPHPEDMGIFSHGQELSSDPAYYINQDEAEYYGIVTMILSPG